MPVLEKKIMVSEDHGLHARPAAFFVQEAAKFESQVTLEKDGEVIDGKSIMEILTLGAKYGDYLILRVEGEDAKESFMVLEKILLRLDL